MHDILCLVIANVNMTKYVLQKSLKMSKILNVLPSDVFFQALSAPKVQTRFRPWLRPGPRYGSIRSLSVPNSLMQLEQYCRWIEMTRRDSMSI